MAYTDLPLSELRAHRTTGAEPEGLDGFWAASLADSRSRGTPARFVPVANGLTTVDSFDVTFAGFGGQPVSGWLHVPHGAVKPLPGVVQYVGYGGGRGLVHEVTLWAQAGYAHFVMDTRGQGSGWSVGVTADPCGSGPAAQGVMTRGITDPADYYYRRLIVDAVRAVDALRESSHVDAGRIAVTGTSQGGGLTIAAAALADGVVAAMPDVPFLCDFPRALQVVDRPPYDEIVRYLAVHRDQVESVLSTLAHVDGAHLARRATMPALFSVALMDPTCPPSTVFAAYNAWAGPKEIVEYPYNGHEGGAAFHVAAQLAWLPTQLSASPV
ncbi:acetylxylan esterase [Terrabacter sp. C0L_2]|uniref:acetylxylan esterase n=1 Tax=Terrabacter sp. C0L_2 TaxID=3108389 RepID=UPI002ED61DDB|nr:acetylxylan esterase [Terrabacter sp. C0L_2]